MLVIKTFEKIISSKLQKQDVFNESSDIVSKIFPSWKVEYDSNSVKLQSLNISYYFNFKIDSFFYALYIIFFEINYKTPRLFSRLPFSYIHCIQDQLEYLLPHHQYHFLLHNYKCFYRSQAFSENGLLLMKLA